MVKLCIVMRGNVGCHESEGTVTTKSLANTFVAPALAEICEKRGKGSLKYALPFEEQLFPILQVFREFCLVKQSDDTLSLLFIFTIQMMQIAVIELQGDNDLQKLTLSRKVRATTMPLFSKLRASIGIYINSHFYKFVPTPATVLASIL